MVKNEIPKNITFNLGGNMEGAGKKRRGRKKKEKVTEVVIKERLPHQKFSHKSNKALDQLLEANREKEKEELEKGLRALVTMRGTGILEDIENDENLKGLPQFGSTTLKIPPFFAVPTKKGWKLANPLTEIRNLAQRQHNLAVNVKRANVKKPELDYSVPRYAPKLNDFSAKDRKKLEDYYKAVKEGKEQEYLFKNKPRGFPAVLYKNAKKAGYKETTEKVYRKNPLKPKKAPSKNPVGRPATKRRLELRGEEDPIDIIERKEREEKEMKEKEIADWKEELNTLTKEMEEEVKPTTERRREIRKRIIELREIWKKWEKPLQKDTYEILSKATNKINEIKGTGLKDIELEKLEDYYEDNDNDDEEGSGGALLGSIGKKAYDALVKPKVEKAKKAIHRITHPKETLQEVKDFGKHIIHGRHDDYPPSAKKILEENASAIVQQVELHRKPLSSVYTTILSWVTKGETDRRLKEQPKDTLYHISMWVKLSNGKRLRIEKNEVINIEENPKKAKEEEVFVVPPPPAGLTLEELLGNTREAVGDKKFFSYSAKDNNCGNFIEMILKTNGMTNKATHDFIGQDTKSILQGFPSVRKIMNTLTDIAGKANVIMEGGALSDSDSSDSDSEKIDWEDIKWGSFTKQFEEYKRQHPNSKIDDLEHFAESILANSEEYKKTTIKRARFYINVIAKKKLSHHNNIMPIHGRPRVGILPVHPALMSDRYPRIPQAFSQIHLAHPAPIGNGSGSGLGGRLSLDDITGGARKMLGVGMFERVGHTVDQSVKQGKKTVGGVIPAPPSRSPITDPSLIGKGMKSGRFAKGSEEAKAWGEKMKALRKK